MHTLVLVAGDKLDALLLPFLEMEGEENPHARFDWYKLGGRWGEFLKLKQPRRTKRLFGLFKGRLETHAITARKNELDQSLLLAEPPAALLFDGISTVPEC